MADKGSDPVLVLALVPGAAGVRILSDSLTWLRGGGVRDRQFVHTRGAGSDE